MIKNYSIQNMKSFKNEANVEIKPITIFVGKNSSGKSSLVRFPVVISQSITSEADTPILFFGKNIDYGNYEDVVFGHDKHERIRFSIDYECSAEQYYFGGRYESAYKSILEDECDVKIGIELGRYSKRVIIEFCEIIINQKKAISISRIQNEKYQIEIYDILSDQAIIMFEAKNVYFYRFIPIIGSYDYFDQIADYYCDLYVLSKAERQGIKNKKKEILRKTYDFSKENEEENEGESERDIIKLCQLIDIYESLLMRLRGQVTQDAQETYYIGPFRENPSRVYRDVEHQVDTVGARGEDVSAMLKNDYTHGKKIISKVSEWFDKSMNYQLALNDMGSGLYNIVIKKNDGTIDNLIDVGYGISQVLPIVAQLNRITTDQKRKYYPISGKGKNNSMFIIEQPELHLHPGAQAELANLFVDAVSQNKEKKIINILIETHSEHLIRRLQALIADKSVDITNKDVAIYYVDKDENNEAYITEMKLEENGQFEREWPSGFFDKAFELSMELVRNNSI